MPRTPRRQSSPPQMRQRSLRLPADTLERLDRLADERGQSANTVAARLIEEGLRLESHPLIYFREAPAGRRPALLGTRLDLAQVIDTVRAHDGSVARSATTRSSPRRLTRGRGACVRSRSARRRRSAPRQVC